MNASLGWSFGTGRLRLLQGDITTADVDAVVNAANTRLAGGGGVDGAIHRASGPKLLEACRALVARQGNLPAGQAVITPGFSMQARHVIHTVGPIWRGGDANEETTLGSAYASCIRLAQENGLQSMAFPAISCGVYGFPVDLAATIALPAMRQGLEVGQVEQIDFYHFSPSSFEQWRGLALKILGAPSV